MWNFSEHLICIFVLNFLSFAFYCTIIFYSIICIRKKLPVLLSAAEKKDMSTGLNWREKIVGKNVLKKV